MRTKSHIAILYIFAGLTVWSSLEAGLLLAQSLPSQPRQSSTGPEWGYLSPTRYTNAFFGFSLPLPEDAVLNEQTLTLRKGTGEHLLLSFHSPHKGLVGFAIVATERRGATEKDAKKAIESTDLSRAKQLIIGGRLFWTAESPGKVHRNGPQTAAYATAIDGYVLEFRIISLLSDTATEMKHEVEQIAFFDASTARSVAGSASSPYTPGFSKFPTNLIAELDSGSVTANVYRNRDLKFHYEFPADWVLMSKAAGKEFMGTGATFFEGNSPAVQAEHETANQCTKQLLFVRRFLKNPSTGQFNPMIVLTAADPRCISRSSFPRSIDDRGSTQQVALDTQSYFKPRDSAPTGPTRFRALSIAGHIVIDISQPFNLSIPGEAASLPILTSTLVMQLGKYWVLWEFASGNGAELEQLKNTKVFFDDVPVQNTETDAPSQISTPQ